MWARPSRNVPISLPHSMVIHNIRNSGPSIILGSEGLWRPFLNSEGLWKTSCQSTIEMYAWATEISLCYFKPLKLWGNLLLQEILACVDSNWYVLTTELNRVPALSKSKKIQQKTINCVEHFWIFSNWETFPELPSSSG